MSPIYPSISDAPIGQDHQFIIEFNPTDIKMITKDYISCNFKAVDKLRSLSRT